LRAFKNRIFWRRLAATKNYDRSTCGQNSVGDESMSNSVAAGSRARLQLKSADVEIATGCINQFDEFIGRGITNSVVICVACGSVRRICEEFIDHYVSDRTAGEDKSSWVALTAVGIDHESYFSCATKVCRYE